MDCVFCDIIAGKAPASVLFEDDDVIAFLDVRPVNYGHTLIIPKKHCQDFLELPDSSVAVLFQHAQVIAKAVVKSLECDGFNMVLNTGKAAGQTVFHFHLHIIPRFFTDDFRFQMKFKQYENDEKLKIAEKIKDELKLGVR